MKIIAAWTILLAGAGGLIFLLTRPTNIENRFLWGGHEVMVIELIAQAALVVAAGMAVVIAIWWAVDQVLREWRD